MQRKDIINEYGMTAGAPTPVTAQQTGAVSKQTSVSPSKVKSASPSALTPASPSAKRGAPKPAMLSLKAQDVPVNSVIKNKAGKVMGTVVEPIEKTTNKARAPLAPVGNKADAIVIKDPQGKYKVVKGKDALIIDDPRVQQESVTKSKLTIENIVTVNNRNYGNSLRISHIEQLPLEEQLILLDKIDTALLNEAYSITVTEAFDAPYPVTWEDSDDFDAGPVKVATANLSDGDELNITFAPTYNDKNTVVVEFYRDARQEITGEGDAYRILATVISAIRDYVKHEAPAAIVFSAVKEWFTTDENYDDVVKSGTSRVKLYNRLVNSFAAKMGYTSNIADKPGKVVYKLVRTAPATESITEGAVPDNSTARMINKLLAKPFPANDIKGQMDAFFAIPDPGMIKAFRQVRAEDGDKASLHTVLRKYVKTLHPAVQKSINLYEARLDELGDLEQAKQDIIQSVNNIDTAAKDADIAKKNADLLDKLYTVLNKGAVLDRISGVMPDILKGEYPARMVAEIAQQISIAPLTYAERARFADNLANNKVINTKTLLSPGTYTIDELTYNDPVNRVVFDHLKNYGVGQQMKGPGEHALAILSKDISIKGKGDVTVSGIPVEIKAAVGNTASGGAGRFGEAIGLPTREQMIAEISKFPAMKELLDAHLVKQKSLNVSGFTALANLANLKPAERSKLSKAVFGSIFGKDATKVISVFNTPNADPEAVRLAYAESNFDWYKNSDQGGSWQVLAGISFPGNSIGVLKNGSDLAKVNTYKTSPYIITTGKPIEMLYQFTPKAL